MRMKPDAKDVAYPSTMDSPGTIIAMPLNGDLELALHQLHRPFVMDRQTQAIISSSFPTTINSGVYETTSSLAFCPACPIEQIGDITFWRDYGLKVNYVAGAMANGIASVELVTSMAQNGMLAFFGSAGLTLEQVAKAVDQLKAQLPTQTYGLNFIHSPNEPLFESKLADLYLQRQVRLVEASAFMDLTLPIVRYRLHGIRQNTHGEIQTPNRVIAKVSRVEVARKFMSPAPEGLVRQLVQTGDLTEEQAQWAKLVPMAQDITAEADSAGHTDNRPAVALLPTFMSLRDRIETEMNYQLPLRIGAAGGIGTPTAAAAFFAMGAAYVVTGSINQACIESGSSVMTRQLLSQAEQADCMMAPAADMFEMGVKVQVLKRGTLFPMRANKLYELYRQYDSLESIPASERQQLEKAVFRCSLAEVWQQTQRFFLERDPAQLDKAQRDPKHRMALVFRWYLGLSSHWANSGQPDRQMDYQIWSGPAMGAFNEWAKGSFLERPENRRIVTVGLNIMYGAGVAMRIAFLRQQGVSLPRGVQRIRPRPLDEWAALLNQ